MVCAAAPRPSQRFLRAAVALLVAFGSLVAGPRSLRAQSGEVVVKSPQAILMDADSGGILFQRNADELVPPASMSKLMLLIMMFNALRAGEITLETEVHDERVRLAHRRRAVAHVCDVRAAGQDRQGRRDAQGHHRAIRQ